MDFNENFILGCSAIGAGLAVIAGIGPGVGRSKVRDHFYHVIGTGSCRDHRSVRSVDCYAAAVRKALTSLIKRKECG